jgi:hypothetical protein
MIEAVRPTKTPMLRVQSEVFRNRMRSVARTSLRMY